MTFPIKPNDEVLIVFADMCMDAWWSSGGIQNWNDRRRHDLSDAIAIPGINSVPNVIPNIASDATELRTKDGRTKVRVENEELTLQIRKSETLPIPFIKTTTVLMTEDGITMSAQNVNPILPTSSSFTISGTGAVNINGDLFINGAPYQAHTHGGVTNGPGFTTGVTP